MNSIAKLIYINASVAALLSGAALADNSTLRQQNDLQRQQAEREKMMTTDAYTYRHSVNPGQDRSNSRTPVPSETPMRSQENLLLKRNPAPEPRSSAR